MNERKLMATRVQQNQAAARRVYFEKTGKSASGMTLPQLTTAMLKAGISPYSF